MPAPLVAQNAKQPAHFGDLHPADVAQPKSATQKRGNQDAPHVQGLPNIQQV
jgi:hypothetical protein